MPKNELIKAIDLTLAAAVFNSGSGASGTSAMERHDLNGPWHDGLLDDAQAPQFLLIDGTRALTGNLTVNTGITIDGVDISVHAANANAHHDTASAGTGISVAGQVISLAAGVAGAGLAHAAGVLSVNVTDGLAISGDNVILASGAAGAGLAYASGVLSVNAGDGLVLSGDNVILASSAAGAGLAYASGVLSVNVTDGLALSGDNVILASGAAGAGLAYASGVLSVNAGDGLVISGDNVAVGVANTGATGLTVEADAIRLTSSSNPGAAAAILASTAAGGLTLQSLTVAGNVDITSGGDLTVGANILFVDVSQVSVGINGAPDPQFALDVYGPARAEYWIGPHALQIKNALLIAHYDGRAPFETNFTGESNGHMGQVATITGGAIWREGKFNKALQIAEATTNLVTNPSFETGTTNWAITGTSSTAQTNEGSLTGSYCLNVNRPSGTTSGVLHVVTTAVQGTYYGSVYVKAANSTAIGKNVSIFLRLRYTDATFTDTTAQNHTLTDAWVRIVSSGATNGAKTLSQVEVQVRDMLAGGTAHAWFMDCAQLEIDKYTPYCDGSLGGYSAGGVANGTGHSWSGTAHASTSSRLAAGMSYPTLGNLNAATGTVAAWINLSALTTGTMHVLRATGTSAGNILLSVTSGGVLQGYWGTGAATDATVLTTDTWHHVAMTYDGTTVQLYLNGQAGDSSSSSGFSGMPTLMYVGNLSGGNHLNGLLDDLLITSDCKTATEILAIYESNAPVFAETARYGFRATPKSLVWADDEGLWMRNTSGQAVFGIYGDDTTTKSWGGLTLASGDLLIGDDSRGGYALWDDSASTLTVEGILKILGTSSFEGAVTLAAGGGIYQGTGTFGTPTTGLKIWNDTGVGRIGGYNAGTIQWYASTDGKLYAGAGNTLIDANGVSVAVKTDSDSSFIASRAFSLTRSGTVMGGMYGFTNGSNTQYTILRSSGDATYQPNALVQSRRDSTNSALTAVATIQAYAYNTSTLASDLASIVLTTDAGTAGSTILMTASAGLTIQATTTLDGGASKAGWVVNEDSYGAGGDFRVESDTDANFIWLDADGSTNGVLYLGGSTNRVQIEQGGVLSFQGTAKVKDGTNIPLDTTTGTKIGTGTTQKLGFWNATPIVRPSAYTQTAYSTAARTQNAITYVAPATYGAGANGYSTAAMASAVHAAVIALAADLANVKQIVNALIDDHQAMGLAG